jgi:hypothetical protein
MVDIPKKRLTYTATSDSQIGKSISINTAYIESKNTRKAMGILIDFSGFSRGSLQQLMRSRVLKSSRELLNSFCNFGFFI